MIFKVDQSILSIFPYFSSAWIRIELSKDAKADMEMMKKIKEDALRILLERVPSCQNSDLEQIPSIKQWLEGYRLMGLRPKKVKPTHFAFSSRILKDKQWPLRSIGPLVDTYLVNQIINLMPHGGFDMNSLKGYETIELIKSEKSTTFQPIGISIDDEEKIEQTKEGELIYQALPFSSFSKEIPITLTRNLNYRDCEKTKIIDDLKDESKSTKDFILIIESLDSTKQGKELLEKTANDLKSFYESIFKNQIQKSFIRFQECYSDEEMNSTKNNNQISLDW